MNLDLLLYFLRLFLQLALLTVIYYWLMRFLKGKSVLMLAIAWLILYGIVIGMKLSLFEWSMNRITLYLPMIVLVLFPTEIRRIISSMTRFLMPFQPFNRHHRHDCDPDALHTLANSLRNMANTRTGALIAIEQTIDLGGHIQGGKHIDAPLQDNSLLETIFYKGSPLHDGGVIIRKGNIAFASSTFPLGDNASIRDHFGTRHQAAAGLSEETDAIVLVVSEETGDIHIVKNGELELVTDRGKLEKQLSRILGTPLKEEDDTSTWLTHFGILCRARIKILLVRFRNAMRIKNSHG